MIATKVVIALIMVTLISTQILPEAINSSATPEVTETEAIQEFQQFISLNNRTYSSLDELSQRYKIFKSNYVVVRTKQIKNAAKQDKYEVGITKFMDLTPAQFKSQYTNLEVTEDQLSESESATQNSEQPIVQAEASAFLPIVTAAQTELPIVTASIPESYDWRNYGIVGPVKNQGSCGSCWAFSSIAALEGAYARKYGVFKSFSEEQLLDCDYNNNGCNGGNQQLAYNYMATYGVTGQSNYPYRGIKSTCAYTSGMKIARASSNFNAGTNEEVIKSYVYNKGPLAVAINAITLQYYTGGIISSSATSCNPNGLNHGVTIVGYGIQNGIKYWIVKNSYGPNWGENGYFRMRRGAGICGINKYVTGVTIA